MISNKKVALIFFCLFVILVLFKIYRFQLLAYTIDDLANNLEATYSWLLDRPLTYANGLGKVNYTHNYFLTPILGPITLYFGPIGIFIFFLSLFVLAWISFYQIFGLESWEKKLLFIFLFLSPTTLWIIDDPEVGWTIELLFLPFTLLFALSLKAEKYNLAIFYAILLIAVREDGIILCCFVQMVFFLFSAENKTFFEKLFSKKIILWVLFWVVLFVASMAYLQLSAPDDTFFEGAMDSIAKNYSMPDFQSKNLVLCLSAMVMLSPFLVLLWLLSGSNYYKIALFVGINMVFISINLLQGARYFDKFFFETVSVTWVPRFVLPFSFSLAFLLLVSEKSVFKILNKKLVVSLIFLLLIQFPIISFFRKDLSYGSIFKSLATGRPEHRMKYLLEKRDLEIIKFIEKTLPNHSTVFVLDYINPIFLGHFHTWPTRNVEFEKADIAIIPKEGFTHLHNQLIQDMKQPYSKIGSFGPYVLYATERYKTILMKNEFLKNSIH